jgi:hypothetical protein
MRRKHHQQRKGQLMKTYLIKDRLPYKFLRNLAKKDNYTGISFLIFQDNNLKAVATNEFRPPRKGELYLSGAVVEAYIAPSDLSSAYRIARVVLFEKVETEVVHEIDDPTMEEFFPKTCQNV